MDAKNCPRCGKIFVPKLRNICDDCIKEEELSFERVREYVKENPNTSIHKVSEECNVPVRRILQYVRDGLIEASAGIQSEVTCTKCGTPILSGHMCQSCALKFAGELKQFKKEEPPRPTHEVKNKGQLFMR